MTQVDPSRTTRVLRERARQLAHVPPAADNGARMDVIQIVVAGERYGIEAPLVREVCPVPRLTPVPCTPAFVLGIMSLRGEVLSVIDLRRFLELPGDAPSRSGKVVVVGNDIVEIGLLADAIDGVRTLPVAGLQGKLPTLSGARERYLRGVTTDRTAVLDMEAILADDRLIVDEAP